MTTRLTFQQAIMRLEQFWSDHGCLIWQPYNVQVGAGTMNPATSLRVLGPEPWRVAYVEPSIRPDDSRYGQNPNRMQQHYQYQVVLKPDPGNAQELYLQSLEALGIERRKNDIRFVEDNWESPALGAWGLGWEVWLNGQEITQFTYFQQAGGITLDPLAVEITYGLERILMALQDVRSFADIWWNESIKYGDLLLQAEIEHSRYNLDCADVRLLARFFADYEREARQCLRQRLVVPAFDYILKCSHTFNVLDARGAIGVTERAHYFARMRNLTHEVAEMYLKQREELGYPLLQAWEEPVSAASPAPPAVDAVDEPGDLVLEIGTEELPVADLASAIEQLHANAHEMFEGLRLTHGPLKVVGTPRHLALCVAGLAARQTDRETVAKGPPAAVAYDQEGRPTKAALGFARSVGVPVERLQTQHVNGRPYVVAVLREEGRPAIEVLRERLPELIASLRFPLTMRWNQTQVAFPRPIRWLVALFGPAVIEFEYAGVTSGRTTRGLRPMGDPEIVLPHARDYLPRLKEQGIVLDHLERRAMIESQTAALAGEVGGRVPEDEALLIEVTNLVEAPTSLRGSFAPEFLELPEEVLITVMQKHQRYFPIVDAGTGRLLPYFIAVRNGDGEHLDIVRKGNEEVLRARYTDAVFFFREDTRRPLEDYLPRLETLTFQEKLGSVLDKVRRLEALVPGLARLLNASDAELDSARRAAHLSKADLATQMVIEFTSLQGVMGREYALRSGEAPEVAQALFEHYLPRYAGDAVPRTMPGVLVALADRLDSLAGLFAVGLAPTGAADPYGLRRAALGLVQILVENGLSFSLRQGLELAGGLLPVEVPPAAADDVVSFVEGRLRVWLREKGFRYDVVEAVLKARGDNPYLAHESATMLQKWVEREDWPSVLNAYGRCYRIVREFDERFPIDPAAFTEGSSKRLYAAYLACRERVDGDATVDELLAAFVPMIQPINVFFDEVLVMDPDPALRQNRLGLLQRIAALADGIVDLSQLEGF